MFIHHVLYTYVIQIYWRVSEARETLSGVYEFEICDTYMYICVYVKHNSSAYKY